MPSKASCVCLLASLIGASARPDNLHRPTKTPKESSPVPTPSKHPQNSNGHVVPTELLDGLGFVEINGGCGGTVRIDSCLHARFSRSISLSDRLTRRLADSLTLSPSLDLQVLEGGWVVTAAHCLADEYGRLGISRINLNLHKNDGEKERIVPQSSTTRVFIPSGYQPATKPDNEVFYGDIALVHVPELASRKDINYPRLPTKDELEDAPVLVAVGVGQTEGFGPSPDELEFVSLQKESRSMHAELSIEEDHFAARDVEMGYQNTCKGDSGGGVFIPNSQWAEFSTGDDEMVRQSRLLTNDRNVLVGIVSWGPNDCGRTADMWGAYTDVAYWVEWMERVMNMNMMIL